MKMWYIYKMEIYSAIKKNDIMPFEATWMELESLILSEVNQKVRHIPSDITHMESKALMNVSTEKEIMD